MSILLLTLTLLPPACVEIGEGPGDGQLDHRSDDVYRMEVARFSHETCSFCPGGHPGTEDWARLGPPLEGDEVLGNSDHVRGFVHRAHELGDLELVGLASPRGVFGGTSRSWNEEEVFDHFVGWMLGELEEAMAVNGVFLSLHGVRPDPVTNLVTQQSVRH